MPPVTSQLSAECMAWYWSLWALSPGFSSFASITRPSKHLVFSVAIVITLQCSMCHGTCTSTAGFLYKTKDICFRGLYIQSPQSANSQICWATISSEGSKSILNVSNSTSKWLQTVIGNGGGRGVGERKGGVKISCFLGVHVQIWLTVWACQMGYKLFEYCAQKGVPTAQPSHRCGQGAPCWCRRAHGTWLRSSRAPGRGQLSTASPKSTHGTQVHAGRVGNPQTCCTPSCPNTGQGSFVHVVKTCLPFLALPLTSVREAGSFCLLILQSFLFMVSCQWRENLLPMQQTTKSTWKWWLEQIKEMLRRIVWEQLHFLPCTRKNVTRGGNDAENDLFVVSF